jgi:hypothetical protein
MTQIGMVYATNPDRRLVAVTDERGFTVLALDSGPAEVGDTLTSDIEGNTWFNKTRSVRLVAYPKARGVRSGDLREHLFPKSETRRQFQ